MNSAQEQPASEGMSWLQGILSAADDGIVALDNDGRIRFLNRSAETMLDLDGETAFGRVLTDLLGAPGGVESPQHPGERWAECGTRNCNHELEIARRDGARLRVELSFEPVNDAGGEALGWVVLLRDRTVHSAMESQLAWMLSHDPLTGLFNRQEMAHRLGLALHSVRGGERTHVFFHLDVDEFKLINDTDGSSAGDFLLQRVAWELGTLCQEPDVAARIGSDEFGILLHDCPYPQAERVAEEYLRRLGSMEHRWCGRAVNLDLTLGATLITGQQSIDEILREADVARVAARTQGQRRLQFYEGGRSDYLRSHEEMVLVPQIMEALRQDRFELYGQPIVPLDASSGGGSERPHFEILLRMHGDDRGLVSPGLFIPTAEKYHLASDVDRWVVVHALAAISELYRNGGGGERPVFGINLSGESLIEEDFQAFLLREVESHSQVADALCFEVTETAAIFNFDRAHRLIQHLREQGCRFALDDFGSGYSSFTYVRSFPVDFIKIDGCFVRTMRHDHTNHTVVQAINNMAHVLGKRTIAEYVEDEQTLAGLAELGIDFAQGYQTGRPRPLRELMDGIGTGPAAHAVSRHETG